MWFIGVEVEQETNAPLLKKILDPPLCILPGNLLLGLEFKGLVASSYKTTQ